MVDVRMENEGRKWRFSNVIDAEALDFERALLEQKRQRPYAKDELRVHLTLYQRLFWYEGGKIPFYYLQISDAATGSPRAQVVLRLNESRIRLFSTVEASNYSCGAVSHEDEFLAFKTLPELLRKHTPAMQVKLRAYRPESNDLFDFTNLSRRAGYKLIDPMLVTRTLAFDLDRPLDEILARLDSRVRSKIRHSSRAQVDIVPLSEEKWIEPMQRCLDAAFSRTGGGKPAFDFKHCFEVASKRPGSVLALGLFLKSHPGELMAFSVDYFHDEFVESAVAGSLANPELRKLPFSFFLFWEKAAWAQKLGAKFIDLGGITDGGATDPLAGISGFKRQLGKREIEIAREVLMPIRGLRKSLHSFLRPT